MAPPPNFAKATIEPDGGGEKLDCWFNPREYTVSKSNNWTADPIVGTALPQAQFAGGNPRELSLDLLFDDSDRPGGDVRTATETLFTFMEPGAAGGGRPPILQFRWGSTWAFKSVCRQLSVTYTLFSPDGTPIRAEARLTLLQTEKTLDAPRGGNPTPGGNPTLAGPGGVRTHVVHDGDSLPSIAYSAYGDATLWRHIAEANGIDDPLRLSRGSALSIPRVSA
jgi:nucleoid-associated protein YgaU